VILSDSGERLRAPTAPGPYNSPDVPDWTAAVAVAYPCDLQPVSSTELVDDQQRVEGRWRLFLPAGADILPTDRWRQDGLTYEVDGEPAAWRSRGRAHHLEVQLKRWRGA
jgi:hypothetical protein